MKNVLVVQLGESHTKKLANILTSETCQKIMNTLATNAYTESDLAKKLQIPLPTIHYNMQQLLKAGIVVDDTYHYSTKGREVKHYKLAKQHIIITPNKLNLASELSWIVPGLLVGLVGYLYLLPKQLTQAAPMMAKTALADETSMAMMASDTAPAFIQSEPNTAVIWAIGVMSTIIIGFLVKYIYTMYRK